MKNPYHVLSICFLSLLCGCASVGTQLPVPDTQSLYAEARAQEEQAFARYKNMRARLQKVSTKILQANTDLCPKTAPSLGVITHSKKTYSKHLREGAAYWLDAKEVPSVFLIGDDSPARKSGVKIGDVFLNVKGKPVGGQAKNIVDANNQIHIQRGDEEVVLTVEAVSSCAYQIRLRMSGAVNAYATGKSIIMTTAMMDFAKTDAELALVIGHELAHNTKGHVPKILRNMVFSGLATRYTRPFEAEADYVGLYHMARAGYALAGVETFWRRLGVTHPKNIVRAKTHPVTPSRFLSIRMGAEEIEEKRRAGKVLVPNLRSGK